MATVGSDEFTRTLVDHVFELWVWPEVQRRGLTLDGADLRKVLVELEPGKVPHVFLNEEVQLVGSSVVKRDIAEGEAVTAEDIEHIIDLRPLSVGPNSGWLVFMRLGSRELISFDFRYNKANASITLDRAREFLIAAKNECGRSAAVAIDLAFSAAELAVQSQMMSLQSDTNNHKERAKWLAGWTRNDNAPQKHADLLYNLADLRASARYGEGLLRVSPDRLPHITKTIDEMIKSAEQMIKSLVSRAYHIEILGFVCHVWPCTCDLRITTGFSCDARGINLAPASGSQVTAGGDRWLLTAVRGYLGDMPGARP